MSKLAKNKSFSDLVSKLRGDFPDFNFCEDEDFHWSPSKNTIFFNPKWDEAEHLLLHELAHASLGHSNYHYDNELIQMEVSAWEYGRQNFYPKYLADFNEDLAEDYLEYYRNWLFDRSLCPNCKLTGQQLKDKTYICLACQQKWQANPAKQQQLKRRKIK